MGSPAGLQEEPSASASHEAQHETFPPVSEGNNDLPWGPVSVPCSAVFVKGACIFPGE